MSYDGGLSIKVVNPELLKILNEYKRKGAFCYAVNNMIGIRRNGKLFAFDYEYLDCAYVIECPDGLDEVVFDIYKVIDYYCDGEKSNWNEYKEQFKKDIKDCNDKIIKGYSFVEWRLYAADVSDYGNRSFDYGEMNGANNKTAVQYKSYMDLNDGIVKTDTPLAVQINDLSMGIPENFMFSFDTDIIGNRFLIVTNDADESVFANPYQCEGVSVAITNAFMQGEERNLKRADVQSEINAQIDQMGTMFMALMGGEYSGSIEYKSEPELDIKYYEMLNNEIGSQYSVVINTSLQTFFATYTINLGDEEACKAAFNALLSLLRSATEYRFQEDELIAFVSELKAKSKTAASTAFEQNRQLIDQFKKENGENEEVKEQLVKGFTQSIMKSLFGEDYEVPDDVDQLSEEEKLSRFNNFLDVKEEQKKKEESEKARKKVQALANGKSENQTVNMFITLTNEKIIGKLLRSDAEFVEVYSEDFAGLKKPDIIKLRKQVTAEMENESFAEYCAECFNKYPLVDRIAFAAQNLNNVIPFTVEYDLEKRIEFAIEKTSRWYSDNELSEVRKEMLEELARNRADLDAQIGSFSEAWTKFSTARPYLQIVIEDKGSEKIGSDDPFATECGSAVAKVGIFTSGLMRMGFVLINSIPWYWKASVSEIWKAALNSGIRDERSNAADGEKLAKLAYEKISAKYR